MAAVIVVAMECFFLFFCVWCWFFVIILVVIKGLRLVGNDTCEVKEGIMKSPEMTTPCVG